jgi:hypothetical protein
MNVSRIFWLLLAFSFLSMATMKADNAVSPVTISLDVQHPGATIPSDFSGLSFESSVLLPNENEVRYFRPDNRALLNLFRTLGIKNLRIGGNTSDRDAKKLPGLADIDSLFAFAKAANVKVIYCLRLHDGDPQADAQTAKYIMDHYAAQMDCFSIGQEPSAYPKPYGYSDYRREWKKFADTIIAAVPNVKFCGPSVHNNGMWARNFMADFGKENHVVLITEHLYAGGAGGKVPSPQIGRGRMLSDQFTKKYEKLHDSFVPMAVANGLPYRLEEANNYFNGGATNVSDTFTSALWGLDFMYWWATHNATGVNFHTGDKVAAGYTLLPSKYTAFFSTTNGFLVRPLGYGIKIFDLGAHGKIIPLTISNPEQLSLSVYAVLNGDQNLYLTIINKEHGENARDAKISLTKAAGNLRRGQFIELAVPDNNVADTAGETLGGATIQKDGTWNGSWRFCDLTFPLIVSASSVVIVKLPNL